MPQPRFDARLILAIALLCLASLVPGPAAADWLITLEGQLIETRGPWKIDDETLIYTDTDGVERRLAVDEVDLEASEETTAARAGHDWEPSEKNRPAPAFELTSPTAAAREAAAPAVEEPPIILYQTSWCGYCRKARKLLTKLDADFVAKDVEKSPKAASEFRRKNGGRGGVPLIDFDGELVRGYNEKRIRELAAKLKEK